MPENSVCDHRWVRQKGVWTDGDEICPECGARKEKCPQTGNIEIYGGEYGEWAKSESLPIPLTRWWIRTRPTRNAIQLGPEGVPACIEFYVPWWAWPFELIHRLVFGKAVLEK